MSQLFHFTPQSANRKIGPIGAITISENSCPSACAFYKKGCYAELGYTKFTWNRANKGITLEELKRKINDSIVLDNLIRYAVAGDLMGDGNKIDAQTAINFFSSLRKKIFSYTHKPVIVGQKTVHGHKISEEIANANIEAIKQLNQLPNVCFNLSSNSLSHADQLADLKIGPVVTVLPSNHTAPTAYTPKGRTIVVCPAQRFENVTCQMCKLCTRKDRSCIVGFISHGSQKRIVDEIINK